MEFYFRQTYFEANCQFNKSNDHYDNDDFKLYLQVEQLILKCATKPNTVSKIYGDDLNPNNIEYQLKTFEPNVESDKMSNKVALFGITSYLLILSLVYDIVCSVVRCFKSEIRLMICPHSMHHSTQYTRKRAS